MLGPRSPRPLRSSRRRSALIALAACVGGCESLSSFDTSDDEVFEGQVFGEDDDGCTDLARCSFIRRGFSGDTRLELTFDSESVQSVAGTLTTTGEACGPTFQDVELRAIEPLLHDQLALYDFPGNTRVRNYIFSATPEVGPLAGRDVMVFLSLLRDDGVEVRVVAGSGVSACDPADCATLDAGGCDFFGVFALQRTER